MTNPGEPHERAPLLAVQALGTEFALEPRRIYALGSDAACDLGVGTAGVAPVALRMYLRDDAAVVLAADGSELAELRQGAEVLLCGVRMRIVADTGNARILPIPALRSARAHSAPPVAPAAAMPAPGHREPEDESFRDLMARELRRAPWFTLSAFAHALLLLMLWWMFPAAPAGDPPSAHYGYAGDRGNDDTGALSPAAPEVVEEPSEADEPALPPPQAEETEPTAGVTAEPLPVRDDHALLREGLQRVGARASDHDDVLRLGAAGLGTGAFQQQVVQLRHTGLDVVFVLDSTGSMGNSIAAAKAGIAQMLDVLRALVPGARFAFVTYRDHGRAEDYLLRVLPIDRDYYAVVNFVHSVEAGGGGDVPEAVLAGLHAAFEQPFRAGARRVVVLAGDAPPHKRDETALLAEVRRFAQTKGSFVHALVTHAGKADGDATASFRRIAERGNGICAPVQDHDRILQQVLALAFGREHATDLESVHKRVDAARRAPPTWALELARTGGPELARAFRRDTIAPGLIEALVRRPRRDVARELAALLGSESLPDAGRQAAAHVLQQQLALEYPPIEPERPRPLSAPRVAQLQRFAASLPE